MTTQPTPDPSRANYGAPPAEPDQQTYPYAAPYYAQPNYGNIVVTPTGKAQTANRVLAIIGLILGIIAAAIWLFFTCQAVLNVDPVQGFNLQSQYSNVWNAHYFLYDIVFIIAGAAAILATIPLRKPKNAYSVGYGIAQTGLILGIAVLALDEIILWYHNIYYLLSGQGFRQHFTETAFLYTMSVLATVILAIVMLCVRKANTRLVWFILLLIGAALIVIQNSLYLIDSISYYSNY